MAYCGKCGTQLSEGEKFCPKCGSPSNYRASLCPKCGTQLSEGAKFCPKCGSSFGSTQTDLPKNEDNSNGFITVLKILLVLALTFCAITFTLNYKIIINYFEQQTKSTSKEKVETPRIKDNPTIKEVPTMQNDEEFKRKTMEYVSQIQQIMVQMNNVFNGYVASRGTDYMNDSRRVNAQADLMDLRIKGDDIFEKMISLARQKRYQEAVDGFKQEKKDFDDHWHEMDKIVNQDMYN